MTPYAAKTKVSVEQTRVDIERVLTRYGADAFGYSQDGPAVRIAFRREGRHYRIDLIMPEDPQGCRVRWRALLMIIKAKLEAAAAGVTSFEDEWLAQTVLPDRQTVGEWAKPQLEEAYRIGAMPKTLMIEGPHS